MDVLNPIICAFCLWVKTFPIMYKIAPLLSHQRTHLQVALQQQQHLTTPTHIFQRDVHLRLEVELFPKVIHKHLNMNTTAVRLLRKPKVV